MPASNRFEQRREQTRQQLLDAAGQVFGKMGYHAASILDITEEADVSKRTFYLHFKDKEDLIEQLALQSFEEVRIKIEQDKAHNDDDMRKIHKHIIRSIFEYAANNPYLFQLIVSDDGSARLNMMAREYIARAMVNGFDDSSVCSYKPNALVPAEIIGNGLGGLIFQLMCWWINHTHEYSPDDMAEMSVSMVFDGIMINFESIGEEQSAIEE